MSNSSFSSSPTPIERGDFANDFPGFLGRVNLNIVPLPGAPQASSQPECNLASSSAIAKPSPVPPVVLALAGSALQNLLKTSEDSPGFNPAPLSIGVGDDEKLELDMTALQELLMSDQKKNQ